MSSLIVRIRPKMRQKTCGQITYEEAKAMYEKGLALQKRMRNFMWHVGRRFS